MEFLYSKKGVSIGFKLAPRVLLGFAVIATTMKGPEYLPLLMSGLRSTGFLH
jgi:hypothetical protein